MNGRIFIFMFLLLSLLGHLGSSVAARGVDITAPSHSLEAAAGVAHNLVANLRDGSDGLSWQAQAGDGVPTVSISSPTEGSALTSTSVTVMGTASDDVGLSKVEVSVDGTNWVMATGTSSWATTVTLPEGESVIQVRATDAAGNTATATVSVTVELAGDGQPVGSGLPAFARHSRNVTIIAATIAATAAMLP